ncbi:MAG: hypothetical protein NTW75_14155 [Planctomycetales bacterium]|nr:hypothetical protein [Planctomycetales bacterium]
MTLIFPAKATVLETTRGVSQRAGINVGLQSNTLRVKPKQQEIDITQPRRFRGERYQNGNEG